jgi:hypothetical protein
VGEANDAAGYLLVHPVRRVGDGQRCPAHVLIPEVWRVMSTATFSYADSTTSRAAIAALRDATAAASSEMVLKLADAATRMAYPTLRLDMGVPPATSSQGWPKGDFRMADNRFWQTKRQDNRLKIPTSDH